MNTCSARLPGKQKRESPNFVSTEMANEVVEAKSGNYGWGRGPASWRKNPLKDGAFDVPHTVGQVGIQSYKLVSPWFPTEELGPGVSSQPLGLPLGLLSL